jgi:hypothetical protein
LSSIPLFEERAKEVGEEDIEATDIEADGEGRSKDDYSEFNRFFSGRPGDFGELGFDFF